MRTLRGRFLAVIFLGVALPVAVAGTWLAGDTRREGEAALRSRLSSSLEVMAGVMGERWVDERSRLLHAVEESEAQGLLQSGTTSADRPWVVAVEDSLALEQLASPAELLDQSGAVRAIYTPTGSRAGSARPASVAVELPVHDERSGSLLGSLRTRLPLFLLLPEETWWGGVAGAVVALFDSLGGEPLTQMPIPASLLNERRFSWNGEDWLVERRALVEPRVTLALAAPVGAFSQPFERAARRGTLALGGVLLVALVVAVLTTRRIVEPLARVATASRAVADGHLDQTVPERGPDELRAVGRAFNAMTRSLRDMLRQRAQRESVAAVGEFATTLAHEIRNPLTALRFDLEHARERLGDPARADELIGRAVQDVERLDRVVSGALSIARSGSLTLAPIDVLSPIRGAAHAAGAAYSASGSVLRLELPSSPVMVSGNEAALHQLMLNLLRNAAEASASGQVTTVSVRLAGNLVRATVHDQGIGMDQTTLARVSEPFFTTKQGGTGLGLAVAQRIAAAHGGSLTIESTPGRGTAVTVELPATTSSAA